MPKVKVWLFGQKCSSWPIIQENMVHWCIWIRFDQEIKITCKRSNLEKFKKFLSYGQKLAKYLTFKGHNLQSKTPKFLLQCSNDRSHYIQQDCYTDSKSKTSWILSYGVIKIKKNKNCISTLRKNLPLKISENNKK